MEGGIKEGGNFGGEVEQIGGNSGWSWPHLASGASCLFHSLKEIQGTGEGCWVPCLWAS